ncbi:MAG TPA: hypothetical protein VF581_04360 [Flavobacterium sp.]|jgi:hypothetical protein
MKELFALLLLIAGLTVSAQDLAVNQNLEPRVESAVDTVRKPSKFMVNVNAGPSFRIGKSPRGLSSEQQQYIKDLKSGFAFDASGLTSSFLIVFRECMQ